MSIFDGLIYGLFQGLTEFLPVSSSGHLLLLSKFGIGENNLLFDVLLHVGTLLAVVICYRKTLWGLIRHPFQKKTLYLIAATVPTCVIALLFKKFLPSVFDGAALPFCFMITAFMLTLTVIAKPKDKPLCVGNSVICGIAQGVATLPGISRSGMTISTMLLLGTNKDDATEFSFLLSIPIIIASAILEGAEAAKSGVTLPVLPTVIGVIVAFVSGLISIKFMLKLIKNKSLLPFAIYTALLSIVLLVLDFLGK